MVSKRVDVSVTTWHRNSRNRAKQIYRPRAVAEERQESGHERKSYIFDLDVREGGDDASDDDATGTYSVDGYECGMSAFRCAYSMHSELITVPRQLD